MYSEFTDIVPIGLAISLKGALYNNSPFLSILYNQSYVTYTDYFTSVRPYLFDSLVYVPADREPKFEKHIRG